ncbi:MAG: helix-turn-helix domain-containing protein [Myxococcaceae bacterium]|nr:helix-turn-helix domain-containing protein [Myxococcaceae bacterium]
MPGPVAFHADTVEVNLIVSGREHVWLERPVPFIQGAGEAVLIPARVEHASWTGGSAVTFHNVHLYRERFDEQLSEAGLRPSSHAVTFTGPSSLRRAMEGLRYESTHGPQEKGHALALDAWALSLSIVIGRQLCTPRSRGQGASRAPSRASVARAEELMRLHPEQAHPLDRLAALAQLSPWHFIRRFKQAFGQTPQTYLRNLRLERARELISTTSLPLTVIAHDVGFGSSSRLSEGFRARFGVTPSSLRR